MSAKPNVGVFAALLLLLILLFFNQVETSEGNDRLPSSIRPSNYKIKIEPYLNEFDPRQFTFDGECFIEIQAVEDACEIQLHMKNLSISLSEYYKTNSTEKTELRHAPPNKSTDIVVYELDDELKANVSYTLHFVYVGSISDGLNGFYRSKYTTPDNVTK